MSIKSLWRSLGKNPSQRREFRGIVVFWVSWHGPLYPEPIFLFPSLFFRGFRQSPILLQNTVCVSSWKWLSGNLHFVQRMPAPQCPHTGESKEIVSFCDASWGLDSVSGAIFVYRGCCIKFFSRKQEVPALSSAEAEIISIVDTAKEMVSLGMLLQTMIQGIPLDPLGMPLQTTGEMGLTMFNECQSGYQYGKDGWSATPCQAYGT